MSLILNDLGKQINDKHIVFERSATQHARMVGELLIRAKKEVQNQSLSWGEWLKTSCPAIEARTARFYMQVARNYEEIMATVAVPDNCTLREFQKLLNRRNPKLRIVSNPIFTGDTEESSQHSVLVEILDRLERGLDQIEEVLDQLPNDGSDLSATLFNALSRFDALEKRICHGRNKLANYQRSSHDCCPKCGSDLVFGLESCIKCGWNVGTLAADSYLPFSL